MRGGRLHGAASVGWLPRLSAWLRVAPRDEEATVMTRKHGRRPVEATCESSDASGALTAQTSNAPCTAARAADATAAR